LLISVISGVIAQERITVTGQVRDESGELLPFVNIWEKGTLRGTSSNLDGKYELSVDGNATLVFSFIGYKNLEIEIKGQKKIDAVLLLDSKTISEVLITAQAKGQRGAIIEQVNSNTIKNVVASDRLQENPDANAVEAIGRLPGISVVRSGGEGAGLVIRGLQPRYTNITLNGIQMPSTAGENRGTNLSGVSQYALQGAEVYKSLTADLDANSVAGTVNLKLKKTNPELHYGLMAQRGYNDLNNDWGNYKFNGEFSNRFFDNKLGLLFTGNIERVNRSVQTMSAGYGIESSDPDGDILLGIVNLNDINSIIERSTAMLSLDYQLTTGTSLMFYGMYNSSTNFYQRQSKSYSTIGNGLVIYNFAENPDNRTDMVQSSLSGESNINFLNIKLDYGLAYSKAKNYNLDGRSWRFNFDLDTSAVSWTNKMRNQTDPTEAVPLFKDDPDKLENNWLEFMDKHDSKIDDENLNAYLNIIVPFNIGELINGNVKLGGMARQKKRIRDDNVGGMGFSSSGNVAGPVLLDGELDWLVLNDRGDISSIGISEGNTSSFLGGDYNFGNRFSFDRLNEISDTWESISDFYLAQGPEVYLPVFGDKNKVGYSQNLEGMLMNDQDIKETYLAGYLMSEINIGKYVMFLPGVRYENTSASLKGFYVMPPKFAPNINDPVSGQDTSGTRSNEFLLPMIHLRIKPIKSFFIHAAYTQALSRPDFNAISPNYYVNSGWPPQRYIAGNPELKPELWTNYDVQFTFHENKIGLFSATLFYKNVQDKIWFREYNRITGDPIPDPAFLENSVVKMSIWENHPYDAYVKGIEFDWQTSFYYLPRPFNFFTLSANYTYSDSETSYPYTRMDLVSPPEGGRPTSVRVDSLTKGAMLLQPRHISNVSLGFNNKGFNVWLSFQYNGDIYTSKNYRAAPRLDIKKDYFYRWDLQVTQKFAIRKVKGFEFMLNLANMSNYIETQHHSGDPRLTYTESYGWTVDFGLRFRY